MILLQITLQMVLSMAFRTAGKVTRILTSEALVQVLLPHPLWKHSAPLLLAMTF
jgi:hypothetical protein